MDNNPTPIPMTGTRRVLVRKAYFDSSYQQWVNDERTETFVEGCRDSDLVTSLVEYPMIPGINEFTALVGMSAPAMDLDFPAAVTRNEDVWVLWLDRPWNRFSAWWVKRALTQAGLGREDRGLPIDLDERKALLSSSRVMPTRLLTETVSSIGTTTNLTYDEVLSSALSALDGALDSPPSMLNPWPCPVAFEPVLLQSGTEGHHHLYFQVLVEDKVYFHMLDRLSHRMAGVIESGYAGVSRARGKTYLRVPWKPKVLKKETQYN
jgi:hypothetical protein